MTSLVSVVGDQTIPNVLFILEMQQECSIDHYLFITTATMEKKDKTECIIRASHLDPVRCERLAVPEDSVNDIIELLQRQQSADRYIVNLTGGTKMMTVGVYNWYSASDRFSEMYYVPIGRNGYRLMYPKTCGDTSIFTRQLTLQEYFDACGIGVVSRDGTHSIATRPAAYTKSFLAVFAEKKLARSSVWEDVRRMISSQTEPDRKQVEYVRDLLQSLKFHPSDPDLLTKADVDYLCGHWLEEYVFDVMKAWFSIDNTRIAYNVKLQQRGQITENEFDCLVLIENTLHIIECKTSLRGESALMNAVYKIAALRTEFGLRAQSHLLTADAIADDPKIYPVEKERAQRLLNVHIVGPSILASKEGMEKEFSVSSGN